MGHVVAVRFHCSIHAACTFWPHVAQKAMSARTGSRSSAQTQHSSAEGAGSRGLRFFCRRARKRVEVWLKVDVRSQCLSQIQFVHVDYVPDEVLVHGEAAVGVVELEADDFAAETVGRVVVNVMKGEEESRRRMYLIGPSFFMAPRVFVMVISRDANSVYGVMDGSNTVGGMG